MQFGKLGRGPSKKGKMLFALDTVTEFSKRLARFREHLNFTYRKLFLCVTDLPYVEHLQKVAR